jgi:glycosyltransferase involved in cell wall biosynthesis
VRILHVVAPAAFGGLERVVQLLVTGQAGSGHEVHVACVSPDVESVAPFVAPLTAAGIHTHPIIVGARAYARERAAIRELCRLAPDVVHTHGYRPDVLDASVPRHQDIPIVTTAHGFTGGPWRNRMYEYLQRRAFRRFDAVVAVARPLGERLARSGVPRSRLHVVPNAWRRSAPAYERAAARQALGLPAEGFIVGWVGRLSGEKGADVLIDSLPHLKAVPLTVSMIGGGPDRQSLHARAAQLAVADQIRWHDAVPAAERLYAAFDVFVLSSRTEGTPVVLFEAMAAGVPIVTTAVGGVPDVVSRDEAVLVSSEDPRALADAIRDVYTHTAAAARRARAARTRLERDYSVGPWLERYTNIYRLVARRRAASTPAVA